MRKLSPAKQKILLLLLGGLTLSLTRTPRQYFKVLGEIKKEWKKIKVKGLAAEIRALYQSKLVETKFNKNGTLTLILTEKGRKKALTYNIDNMKIPMQRWDGKWRIVIFDVPEERKNARNALREKLKNLGFCELQKSVFVHPFSCKDQIDFIIEFFELRPNVRYGVLESIDNELHLKNIFNFGGAGFGGHAGIIFTSILFNLNGHRDKFFWIECYCHENYHHFVSFFSLFGAILMEISCIRTGPP